MDTSTRWWLRTDKQEMVINAAPDRIYGLVADLPRMGEWSPECQTVEWGEGASGPEKGARFVGHNATGPKGLIKWSRKGRVLVADAGRAFSFVTEEGGKESTEWRFELEPVAGGTKVTERYVVHMIPVWARVMDVPTNRAKDLRKAMTTTLTRLKAAAEQGTAT